MHHFKPKMKDGMGKDLGVSPEAHKEWSDKEGKHSSMGIKGMGGPGAGSPVVKSNARDFSDNKRSDESARVSGSKGDGRGKPAFPSYSGSAGHKTGPQRYAGKGEEGSTKGAGGAGKLNSGNGLHSGKKMSGMVNGKKVKGDY